MRRCWRGCHSGYGCFRYGPCGSTSTVSSGLRSARLDSRRAYHFSPLLDFRRNERAELFRRAAGGFGALGDQALGYFRRVHASGYFTLQLDDDVARRARRCEHAVPGARLVAGHAGLLHGRQIRQRRRALRPGHCQSAQPAALERRHAGNNAGEGHCHLAADDIDEGRRHAFVGHVLQVDPGENLEQLAGQVAAGSVDGRSEAQLSGARFGQHDQFFDRACRHARVDQQHQLLLRDQRYLREILGWMIRKLAVQADISCDRGDRAHDQGVAVRRRFGSDVGGDGAARSGPVVDHHLLAPAFSQLAADQARQRIDRTARCARHQHANRARRIALRAKRGCGHGEHRAACHRGGVFAHLGRSFFDRRVSVGYFAAYWRRASMTIKLTPELEEARAAIRKFVDNELEPWAKVIDDTGELPAGGTTLLQKKGYLGLALEETYGGAGVGLAYYCLVLEEMGRSHRGFSTIVGATSGNTPLAIMRFGTDEQRKKYLPGLAGGP